MYTGSQSAAFGNPEPLTEDSIRRQLDRILASPGFHSSGRMSRFLRFVVQETLDNGTDAVKEVTVAMAAFDRPADFNPKLDPVVRNEARRLRGKLEAYYAGEGAADRVRISIPKGGYAPHFEALETAAPAAGSSQPAAYLPASPPA